MNLYPTIEENEEVKNTNFIYPNLNSLMDKINEIDATRIKNLNLNKKEKDQSHFKQFAHQIGDIFKQNFEHASLIHFYFNIFVI